jgi:hypothetical protein
MTWVFEKKKFKLKKKFLVRTWGKGGGGGDFKTLCQFI